MSDILIRGMEMPKRCIDCPCEYDCILCKATGNQFMYRSEANGGYVDFCDTRMPDCPLIELPPHGRLIDADALMLIIKDYIDEYSDVDTEGYHNLKWCAMKEVEMAIEDATTVIEESDKT